MLVHMEVDSGPPFEEAYVIGYVFPAKGKKTEAGFW